MGTHIVYLEPDGVGEEISDTGQFAARGVPIEVETDVAELLLEQKGKWARPTTKKAKAARRRTPRPKSPPTPEVAPPDVAAPEDIPQEEI